MHVLTFMTKVHKRVGNWAAGFVQKDFPIVLQCRTGLRSAIAVSILQKVGIKEVVILKGGFLAWKKAGLPYTTYNLSV